MKKFKYTTQFNTVVHASSDIASFRISEASLEPLRELIPDSVSFDRNIDLLGVAFNAAVANKFNKNGDGIDSASAVDIAEYFIHKPTNIEHQKDAIVGHIVSAGFSEYEKDNALSSSAAAESTKPFNIALGAVVYRSVNPEFADMLLQSSDPTSDYYQSVSASWEIGFNEYAIALGSNDLSDAEVITDPGEVEELSKHLKSLGGEGKTDDGRPVNRLITGEIFPLGIGFTNNPAADVLGVLTNESEIIEEEAAEAQEVTNEKTDKEKSSHLDSVNVIQNEPTNFLNTMEKTELLKDIEQLLSEKVAAKDFSEEAIANITKVFHDAIREKSEEYVNEIEQVKAEKSEAEKEGLELNETIKDLAHQLKDTQGHLETLEKEKDARESQARFDARMEQIEEVYQLEDGDRKIVAAEVDALDQADEAFAEYQDKLSVVFKSKSKEYLQKLADEMEAKIEAEVQKRLKSAASVEATEQTKATETSSVIEESLVEDSLDKATPEDTGIPNNNGESIETEETLRERFAKAFKDSVSINF
jgi:hypothetical protein